MKRKKDQLCYFCNGHGMTKEHVWSDWLSEHIKDKPVGKVGFPIDIGYVVGSTHAVIRPRLVSRRDAPMTTYKMRRVCERCNSGWMSEAVQAAKPFALAMIKNEEVELDESAQRAIALWMAISTVMAELTDPPSARITAEEREIIYKTKAAPPQWRISLGRYQGTEREPIGYQHFGGGRDVLDPKSGQVTLGPGFHFSSHVMGSLLVNVVGSALAEHHAAVETELSKEDLVRIHPCADKVIKWPCTKAYTDADFKRLGNIVGIQLLKLYGGQ